MRSKPGDHIHAFTREDAELFLAEMIGPDWEELFLLEGAVAGPDANDAQVEAAAERAIQIAHSRSPDLTDTGLDMVEAAWFTIWADVPPEWWGAQS